MIGKNINEIRKKRGFTLSELAERAKVSKSYLSNIERNFNRNPSIEVMKKISLVLDVDLKTLLKTEAAEEFLQITDQELFEFIHELKESGLDKEQLKEYKALIQFIKWKKKNLGKEK